MIIIHGFTVYVKERIIIMPVSEAKKKASAKWDKAHMTTMSCKLTKERAARFKAACEMLGLIPNQVFNKAIDEVLEKAEDQG